MRDSVVRPLLTGVVLVWILFSVHIRYASAGSPTGQGSISTPSHQSQSENESISLSSFIVTLMLCIFFTLILHKSSIRWLPESVVIIGLGAIVGAFVRGVGGYELISSMRISSESMLLFFVPPIIFDSGYTLQKGDFFKGIGTILVFAVLGTVVSTFVMGLGVFLLGQTPLSYSLSLAESLVFGALISSVDPVATLAIFRALNVNRTLYMLVFGESILNDAVAIALFRSFSSLLSQHEAGASRLMGALIAFMWSFLGSVFLGIAIGLTSSLIFKYITFREFTTLEISLFMVLSYVPYAAAEALGLSGILAILTTGIMMSHYTYYNLSSYSQITSQQFFRMLAFIAETLLFADLGISIFVLQHRFHAGLIIVSIILLLVSRACNVFPLSWMVNRIRKTKIETKSQFIMWFSGLRGAISFALSLNIPSVNQDILVTTTLICVLFSIVILGGGTLPLLRVLKVERASEVLSISRTVDLNVPMSDSQEIVDLYASANQEEDESWFEAFDRRYIQPCFRSRQRALHSVRIERELQLYDLDDDEDDLSLQTG